MTGSDGVTDISDDGAGDAVPADEPGARQVDPNPFAGVHLGRVDILCIGPIVLATIWSLVGIPIAPGLLNSHPVLLAALRGSVPAMITCGSFAHAGRIPLWQALVAPVPALMWVDPFYYWAGRRYGRLLLDYYKRQSPRMDRRISRAERLFARYGIWTIVVSVYTPIQVFLYLAAGETRLSLWKFLIADFISNVSFVILMVSLGWVFRDEGIAVADTVGHYGLILTVALVVVVVVLAWRQASGAPKSAEKG